MRYNVIYIYGLDGSGKSTVCKNLQEELKGRGIKTTYSWMRFNHFLSKIVNAIGRLTGFSFYVTYPDGTKIGYHHYYQWRFLGKVYILTTIIDTFLASLFRLWILLLISRKVIILDRYCFDIMVDLSVDSQDTDLIVKWPAKLLKKMLPLSAFPIYLKADKEIIHKRRPDTKWDENFDMRKELYQRIYDMYGRNYKVDNNGDIEVTIKSILEMVG